MCELYREEHVQVASADERPGAAGRSSCFAATYYKPLLPCVSI